MKITKTYFFQAKHLTTNQIIEATIEASGKEMAQKAAMMDTRFKGWKVLLGSFRRTDTAKGVHRAGGLDADGKQITAKTLRNND